MAIVKMKKLHVMAMAERRRELLRGLLRLGCVEISEPDDLLADPAWSALLERDRSNLVSTKNEIADVNTALAAIRKYAKVKNGLFVQRQPISEEAFLDASAAEKARVISDEIGDSLQSLSQLQGEEGRLEARKAALLPWKSLDMPLEMRGTRHTLFTLMVCPAGADTGSVRGDLTAAAAAEWLEISADKQQRYGLLICHRADEEAAMDVLRRRGFSAVSFQGTTGTPAENLAEIERQLAENQARQQAAVDAIAGRGADRDALRVYADRLGAEAAEERSAECLLTDGTIVFFTGWAPAERLADVETLLEELDCAWDASDPTPEEYPDVPVQLKNNWLTRPLNMVTEMYSLPAYSGIDPNPLMAPFFILFYGIMLADMGYGLLMILAGIFITKKYRPKGMMGYVFRLTTLCGISTFVMGALTGGFFGDFLTQLTSLIHPGSSFALPALFTPLDDTLMILVGAMALGFVQIVTGMAISVIRKVKQGKFLDALWEEITWWVVFAGLALAILGVTNVVLYAGIVLVVAGPVLNGKGFGRITGIFSSLYNHITGYFGDILSYSRLMALMLAGSVIAQVFNTLGAIPGNIVIFLLISLAGNTLNFALNLLGCYVHDLRLQCLEFFKNFYEDGGKPFCPLAVNTKYVDIEQV